MPWLWLALLGAVGVASVAAGVKRPDPLQALLAEHRVTDGGVQ